MPDFQAFGISTEVENNLNAIEKNSCSGDPSIYYLSLTLSLSASDSDPRIKIAIEARGRDVLLWIIVRIH